MLHLLDISYEERNQRDPSFLSLAALLEFFPLRQLRLLILIASGNPTQEHCEPENEQSLRIAVKSSSPWPL